MANQKKNKRKATAAQIAANRANAQKSTGPRTAAGLEKVSHNRTTHGLCSDFSVLACEDQAEYDDLFNRFLDAEKPVDDVERELVAKMARHTWQSERAQRFQDGCFIIYPQSPELEANRQDDIAVRKDLDNYLRYQAHHDRAYQRAANALAKRRAERRKEQIGFESQKRHAVAELRRENQEQRRIAKEKREVERHALAMAERAERLEGHIMRNQQFKARTMCMSAGGDSLSSASQTPSRAPHLVENQPSAA